MKQSAVKWALGVIAVLALGLVGAGLLNVERATDTYALIAATLAVLVGVVSAAIAAGAIREAGNATEGANRIQSEIRDLQDRLVAIEEERADRERAEAEAARQAAVEVQLTVIAEQQGRRSYRAVIANVGSVEARDVFLRLHPPHEGVLMVGNVEMPIPLVPPDTRIPFVLAASNDDWFPFRYTLQWKPPGDHRVQEREGTLHQP